MKSGARGHGKQLGREVLRVPNKLMAPALDEFFIPLAVSHKGIAVALGSLNALVTQYFPSRHRLFL